MSRFTTRAQAEEVISLGHLVSFTGIVTFKNGASVREVAAGLSLGEFMVETRAEEFLKFTR